MRIYYTHKAIGDLKALPKDIQKRIAKKMRFYASCDDPLKFAKNLVNSDEGQFRFRIGDYRVIFDVSGQKIFVLKIDKRDKIYNE